MVSRGTWSSPTPLSNDSSARSSWKDKTKKYCRDPEKITQRESQDKSGHEQKQGTTAARLHTAPPWGVKPPQPPVSSYLITLLDALKVNLVIVKKYIIPEMGKQIALCSELTASAKVFKEPPLLHGNV